ncbi:ABC transporter substrate-binding protein [Streptomyces sp. NBC_00344]|uniref:ABC transporter substrate-binding protein n=1 Tax=Streptomyces sp. NBC_00344 TaxID=2975720 RepID=UPI002E23D763
MQQNAWQFSDDRGQLSTADRPPSKVIAYIQAGATLWDHRILPGAVFGSSHDGAIPDPAKAGTLPLDRTGYLGAGGQLDLEALLRSGPELVVAVSYGGGQVYGLDPETAKHLEEHVPVVVIDVGRTRSPGVIAARFEALAVSLGAAEDQEGAHLLTVAQRTLAAATETEFRPRLLALSPAGPEQVHLARPDAWPQLRELSERGVNTVQPPGDAGANWATVGWAGAAELRPDVVLVDVRCNATSLGELRDDPAWQAVGGRAEVVTWNPEAPCTARAHARFLTAVAGAIRGAPGR